MLRAQKLHRLAQAYIWRGVTASSSLAQQCGPWQHGTQQQQDQQQRDQQQSPLWPSQHWHYHTTSHNWQQQPHQQQPDQQQQQQQPAQQQRSPAVLKLYKGNWILPVRFLVRAKVFQLVGGGSFALLLGSLTLDEATSGDVWALTALAGGLVAASYCLWYYSRRYVGEMALMMPDAERVRFSVLDFWGNREDVVVPISAMTPPFKGIRKKEMERLASQILFPVTVVGDRQYYLSIHAGKLFEPQVFMSMMKGEFSPQDHPSVTAAQEVWQHKLQQQAAVLEGQQQQPQQSEAADAAQVQ